MLTGKWWITPEGSVRLDGTEHMGFALHYILHFPLERKVPQMWEFRGVPPAELEAALARGADPKAIEFISKKGNDARLWAMREYGWIRVVKGSVWNLWKFDEKTVSTVRDAKDYWSAQKITKNDFVDIEEFGSGEVFSVPVFTILDKTDPKLVKNVALGLPVELPVEEVTVPSYAGRSELERRVLLRKSGDNPRRRR